VSRALTDASIRNLQAPTSGRIAFRDHACPGLELRVTSTGAKTFAFRYRAKNSKREDRITLGRYPDVMLRDARTRAHELRRQIAAGLNPAIHKREASSRTFAALAARYLEEHSRRFKRSFDQDERNLRLHVLPRWGRRDYTGIGRADIIALVEKLIAANKPVLANRVQALISSVFSFAVDAALLPANPCLRLRKRGQEQAKTRTLSDNEIRVLWHRAVEPPVSRAVGLALRLALLTGCRAGEIAGMRTLELEISNSGEIKSWLVPANRTKNGRAHYVSLAPLAAEQVRDALALANGDISVFPSRAGTVTAHALAVAMARIGKAIGANSWPSTHDLRRTCATRLAAAGVPAEDIQAVLNHARGDVTGRHYDQYERGREKQVALNRWAQLVAAILAPEPADNVVAGHATYWETCWSTTETASSAAPSRTSDTVLPE
jgi:integrase